MLRFKWVSENFPRSHWQLENIFCSAANSRFSINHETRPQIKFVKIVKLVTKSQLSLTWLRIWYSKFLCSTLICTVLFIYIFSLYSYVQNFTKVRHKLNVNHRFWMTDINSIAFLGANTMVPRVSEIIIWQLREPGKTLTRSFHLSYHMGGPLQKIKNN